LEEKQYEQTLKHIDINAPVPLIEPMRQYYYIKKCQQYVNEASRKSGRRLSYWVETFGCQMNARDSEKLKGFWNKSVMYTQKVKSRLILLFSIPVPFVRMLTYVFMAVWGS